MTDTEAIGSQECPWTTGRMVRIQMNSMPVEFYDSSSANQMRLCKLNCDRKNLKAIAPWLFISLFVLLDNLQLKAFAQPAHGFSCRGPFDRISLQSC